MKNFQILKNLTNKIKKYYLLQNINIFTKKLNLLYLSNYFKKIYYLFNIINLLINFFLIKYVYMNLYNYILLISNISLNKLILTIFIKNIIIFKKYNINNFLALLFKNIIYFKYNNKIIRFFLKTFNKYFFWLILFIYIYIKKYNYLKKQLLYLNKLFIFLNNILNFKKLIFFLSNLIYIYIISKYKYLNNNNNLKNLNLIFIYILIFLNLINKKFEIKKNLYLFIIWIYYYIFSVLYLKWNFFFMKLLYFKIFTNNISKKKNWDIYTFFTKNNKFFKHIENVNKHITIDHTKIVKDFKFYNTDIPHDPDSSIKELHTNTEYKNNFISKIDNFIYPLINIRKKKKYLFNNLFYNKYTTDIINKSHPKLFYIFKYNMKKIWYISKRLYTNQNKLKYTYNLFNNINTNLWIKPDFFMTYIHIFLKYLNIYILYALKNINILIFIFFYIIYKLYYLLLLFINEIEK